MNKIKTISLIFIFFIINISNAQKAITTYLDVNWKPCTPKEAFYFRKAYKLDNNYWNINDYYLDGKIQMRGTFKTDKAIKEEGYIIQYYKNGKKKEMGNFKNGKSIGKKRYWFKDGSVKAEGQFDQKGNKIGLWQGRYSNHNKSYIGNYANDKMIGEWYWYFNNGQISSYEVYKKGKLKHVEFFNKDGSKYKGKPKLYVISKFRGGKNAMVKYLTKNTKYKKNSKLFNSNNGTVIVGFTVGVTGKISDVVIKQPASYLLNVEAGRLVLNMPNWIPSKMHNRPVTFRFSLPLNFNNLEYTPDILNYINFTHVISN